MTRSCERVQVHVKGYGVIEACHGDNLGRILASKGILPLPCGGNGLCGLCKVRVRGRVSPPTGNEVMRGLGGEVRLACQTTVLGDVEVELLARPVELRVRVSTISTMVEPGKIEPIVEARVEPPLRYGTIVAAPERGEGKPILVAGRYLLLTRGDPSRALLVDVGTTKIAYQLVDVGGRILGEGVLYNPLNKYGSDIVSRITVAYDEPERLGEMSRELRATLRGLAEKYGPGLVLAAGNSANTHLLLGLPVESLAAKPFQPLARGPFITYLDGYPLIMAPLIGGFVGGDAYAALVASLAMNPPRPYLLIDIGTNTETILVTEEAIYAASTPAGPAFEGHLESSSAPVLGGITRVKLAGLDSGKARFTVESTGEPRGFLGPGVVSLVAELRRHGLVDESGRFTGGYVRRGGVKAFVVEERYNVVFTQRDMREFQKAYAAVKTSWRILLSMAGLRPSDLKLVLVAGTFGSSLDKRDLVDLGLVPVCDESRVAYAGNIVLSGLRVMLLSREWFNSAEKILGIVRHVNLAEHPDYTRVWVESLRLTPACGE